MNTEQFEKTIEQLGNQLKMMRASQANPAIVEDVVVNAYESTMKLQELAGITVQDGQTLVIQPWDATVTKAIEEALREREAEIGVGPVVDGEIIRLSFPPMTEENRINLVKQMNEKVENARVSVRKTREQLLKDAKAEQKSGDLSEDEYFRLEKEVQETVDSYNKKIEDMAEEKEKSLMTV